MFRRPCDRHQRRGKEGSAPSGESHLDESLRALAEEISALGRLQVPQAAKERGWATLQRELERRPVRPAAQAKHKVQPARNWRWAIVSAAVLVAVTAGVPIAYAAGAFQTASVADNGSSSTLTSVVSSSTTQPSTTVPTDGTTVSSDGPGTTGATTVTTQSPGTTVPTDGTTVTTQNSDTTNATTGTTRGPTTTHSPTTTQPVQTTTTGEQQLAAAQRDKTAKAVVFDLGSMVVDYFVTGDMSGARALVASGAQFSLVQMISSLNDPNGYRWISTKVLTGDTVRITLEFSDRVANGQGELVEVVKRFRITVRVGDESAVITAISAGS